MHSRTLMHSTVLVVLRLMSSRMQILKYLILNRLKYFDKNARKGLIWCKLFYTQDDSRDRFLTLSLFVSKWFQKWSCLLAKKTRNIVVVSCNFLKI